MITKLSYLEYPVKCKLLILLHSADASKSHPKASSLGQAMTLIKEYEKESNRPNKKTHKLKQNGPVALSCKTNSSAYGRLRTTCYILIHNCFCIILSQNHFISVFILTVHFVL